MRPIHLIRVNHETSQTGRYTRFIRWRASGCVSTPSARLHTANTPMVCVRRLCVYLWVRGVCASFWLRFLSHLLRSHALSCTFSCFIALSLILCIVVSLFLCLFVSFFPFLLLSFSVYLSLYLSLFLAFSLSFILFFSLSFIHSFALSVALSISLALTH